MPRAEEPAAPAAENQDEEPGADPWLRLLGAYVARSLRPAAGAWERCAGTAEAERLLQAFLGRSAAEGPWPLLVVQPGPGGLALRSGLDAGPESGLARAKGLFFLRTRSEPPGTHSLRGAVLCGDLPAAPLQHLAALFSEVIIPVLANEKNHLDWPHMVCQDIRHHSHALQCDLLVMLEHVKGRTSLPLPVGTENMEFTDCPNAPVLSLCGASCPRTCCEAQAGLRLKLLVSAAAFPLLEQQAWDTTLAPQLLNFMLPLTLPALSSLFLFLGEIFAFQAGI